MSIGYAAFKGCSNLASINIPNNITSIGGDAFEGCSGLTSVTSLNTTPLEIDQYTFNETIYKQATLYVPKGCKTIYWLHPYWENFKNIVEIDNDLVGDANSDGIVNAVNIVEMVNYIIGKPSSTFNNYSADMNGDGVVNAVDVTLLINTMK